MSEMREQAPASTTRVPQPRAGEARAPQPTAWTGWVLFGAVMMVLLGSFQVIAGLVALFDDGYYLVVSDQLMVNVDYNAWGTAHLVIGLIALAAGFGLMTGAMWARVTGIVVAVISALVNLAFIPAFPIWAVTMIALDVIVIYAITAHGGELKTQR
ncbi:DUF7144 family membrane protein [Nocardioides mesophilus]|uniref:DUF7144 domain-containing protein n=1 Tax=Nocardioides mesophilus TaxID=433659 RepID=A0A7G9RB36_9ACTN|nr:hypothetical protein [Nocardioides mesophilus]QNN52811.1 hypothetical protein H9L09_20695 [Nocardioides mesophilus]